MNDKIRVNYSHIRDDMALIDQHCILSNVSDGDAGGSQRLDKKRSTYVMYGMTNLHIDRQCVIGERIEKKKSRREQRSC